MDKRTLVKLAVFNLALAVADVVLLSPGLVGGALGALGTVGTAASVTIAVMSAFLFIGVNRFILTGADKKPPAPEPLDLKPVYSLEDAAQSLEAYSPQTPSLGSIIDAARRQAESIRRKQRKAEEIWDRNEYTIDSVQETLAEAEGAILANLKKLLNRVTIWDEGESGDPRKYEIYNGHRRCLNELLHKNDEILDSADVLLVETAKYISETKSGSGPGDVGIKSMIQALKSLNEGGKELE
ncbi:MAG: hypothetical protein LBC56_08405 [Oscillospiraceae bacterium]|nr:hypothetical protein [Oscillospiraceae bacterium]